MGPGNTIYFALFNLTVILLDGQYSHIAGFPGGSVAKNLIANTGDASSIPGSGRSPGIGDGNPLQYSCLENSMDRGVGEEPGDGIEESDMTE